MFIKNIPYKSDCPTPDQNVMSPNLNFLEALGFDFYTRHFAKSIFFVPDIWPKLESQEVRL